MADDAASASQNDGFALLWGSRERPPRGRKPALSLDAIVAASIDLVDADGFDVLTMTRVAARLDVTPMALYRYVPGKEELVDLIMDAALGLPSAPAEAGWRAGLSAWAHASFTMFQRRPWLLELLFRRVPVGPNWVAWLNAALDAIADCGLSPSEMVAAVLLVDGHVRTAAYATQSSTGTRAWAERFGSALRMVASDPRYAAITRVANGGAFGGSDKVDTFEFGLERLLDGIDAEIRARKRRGRAGKRRMRSS